MKRQIPDIVMDMMRDYPLIDGGEKPLLDYLDELMAAYAEMEKTFMDLELWQEDLKKDLREMKLAMEELKEEK